MRVTLEKTTTTTKQLKKQQPQIALPLLLCQFSVAPRLDVWAN